MIIHPPGKNPRYVKTDADKPRLRKTIKHTLRRSAEERQRLERLYRLCVELDMEMDGVAAILNAVRSEVNALLRN